MIYLVMFFGVIVILLAIIAVIKMDVPENKKTSKKIELNQELVERKLSQIDAMLTSPNGLKSSLIEADKLLDYTMKHTGATGSTFAERLKSIDKNNSMKTVWAAHKLRNYHAHDINADVVKPQVTSAVAELNNLTKKLAKKEIN